MVARAEKVGRAVVEVPLVEDRLDFDGLERAFAAGARTLLLCNPHNPTGRVLTREELERVAELARAHDVLVVSDEIHSPMAHPPAVHTPFGAVAADGVENVRAIRRCRTACACVHQRRGWHGRLDHHDDPLWTERHRSTACSCGLLWGLEGHGRRCRSSR